ncbi:hypothetical protein [Sinorhizobium meliloti]|uniref:hypothetical protein n=1 Tax=Rhizobium meliloti TaxID=382 RepID=UPI000370944B|nr:hypothetical protein [Sinorhizobium meliloti]
MERECLEALDDAPLRQGDIFLWVGHNNVQPWSNYGVVVTADCDLEQNKTHGRLSYIPAVTMDHYIWMYWVPSKFDSTLKDLATKASTRISRIIKKVDEAHAGVSVEAILSWIRRSDPFAIIQELRIEDKGQRENVEELLSNVKQIDSLLASKQPDMLRLKKCFGIKSNKFGVDLDEELIKQLQNSISNLPGDVFFLSGIPSGDEHALFLMLRHISQCDITDIGVNQESVKWGGAKAKRVARIAPPYRYAITQNLARVFSDIGLPGDYSERRKASTSRFVLAGKGA